MIPNGESGGLTSVLAIGIHKAGSSVFERLLSYFAREVGLAADPLSRHFSASPYSQVQVLRELEPTISQEGVFYGVVRSPHFMGIRKLQDLRLITQVRDPRDCLTSQYFSLGYSHSLPVDKKKRERFLSQRETIRAMRIDEFVLSAAVEFQDKFQRVATLWRDRPDLEICKYEVMVKRPDEWRRQVAGFFGLKLTPDTADALDRVADFSVDQENMLHHKRQVEPGDHRRKLKPETIRLLNQRFEHIMGIFGYEADARPMAEG